MEYVLTSTSAFVITALGLIQTESRDLIVTKSCRYYLIARNYVDKVGQQRPTVPSYP